LKPLRKNHEENTQIMMEELAYNGVSVIIPRRECIVAIDKRVRAKAKAKAEDQA
jgi:indolepyruvate ferredoxin oxidoreductase alpha subunit